MDIFLHPPFQVKISCPSPFLDKMCCPSHFCPKLVAPPKLRAPRGEFLAPSLKQMTSTSMLWSCRERLKWYIITKCQPSPSLSKYFKSNNALNCLSCAKLTIVNYFFCNVRRNFGAKLDSWWLPSFVIRFNGSMPWWTRELGHIGYLQYSLKSL